MNDELSYPVDFLLNKSRTKKLEEEKIEYKY